MTRITPSIMPFVADEFAAPAGRTGPKADESGFVRILAQESTESEHEAPDGKALPAEVAHVFNAFGFFPAPLAVEASAIPSALSPAALRPPDDLPAPATGLPKMAVQTGWPTDECAQTESAPETASSSDAAAAIESDKGLDNPPVASPAALAHDRAVSTFGPQVPRPQTRSAVASRVAPTAVRTDTPRHPTIDRSPIDWPAERPPANHGPNWHAHGAGPQRDRLVFRIGSHVVELIGRLDGLSEEEREQLIAALDDVLESHGLSLTSATINGRPFAGLLQGQR